MEDQSSPSMSATEDRGPLLLQAIWIEATIASFFIAARIIARIKIQGRLSLDDYLMIFSLVVPSPSLSVFAIRLTGRPIACWICLGRTCHGISELGVRETYA